MVTKLKNKGNISIDKELLNKYSTVRKIFDDSKIILKNKKITIKLYSIPEIEKLNFSIIKIGDLKKLAIQIFNNYHDKNIFENNGNFISVSKHGIEESIEKIYNNFRQRKFIVQHLIVFSSLGLIIEDAYLVSQTYERKNRENLLYWNYYLDNLLINDKKYTIEFDVRSMEDGSNQYRIQRIEIKNK